jgi:hypothetical protein
MAKRTTRLCQKTVKRAILGSGLGTGLGLIGVALMASAAVSVHKPERLFEETLMLMMGGCTGLVLGWLAGPRQVGAPVLAPKAQPVPVLAYTPVRQQASAGRVALGI